MTATLRAPLRSVRRSASLSQPSIRVLVTIAAAVLFGVVAWRLPFLPPWLYFLAIPVVVGAGLAVARGPRWCLIMFLGATFLGLYNYSVSAGPIDVRVTDLAYVGLVGWVLAMRSRLGPRRVQPIGQKYLGLFIAALGMSLLPVLLRGDGDVIGLVVSWLRLVGTISLVWLVPYVVLQAGDRRLVFGAIAFFCSAEIVRAVVQSALAGELGARLQGGNGPNADGLLAAVLVVMAVHAPVPKRARTRFLMLTVGVVGLVLSGSIGSITAAGLALGVYGLKPRSTPWGAKAEALVKPARFLLILGAALGLAIMIKPQNFPDSPDFADSSTAHRLVVGGAGLELFLEQPVTGVGWQRSARQDVIGADGVTEKLRTRFGDTNREFFPDRKGGGVHNAYVQVLAEAGLIGFSLLLALVFVARKRIHLMLRNLGRDPTAVLDARCALVLLVVVLVWWNENPIYGAQPETVLAATFVGLLASFAAVRTAGVSRVDELVAAPAELTETVGRRRLPPFATKRMTVRAASRTTAEEPVRYGRRGRRPEVVVVGNLPEPVGGVEEHCYEVCADLARRGVGVHFLDTEPHSRKWLPALASYSIATRHYAKAVPLVLNSPGILWSYFRIVSRLLGCIGPRRAAVCLFMAARIADVTRRCGADHIVVHHAGQRGLAALVAAKATRSRLTVFTHGAEWSGESWAPFRPVARLVGTSAQRLIANSRHTAETCCRSVGSRSIEILNPGVNHAIYNPSVKQLHPEHRGLTVLFLSRMSVHKGSTTLAEAIPWVRADVPVRFIFAGPDHGAKRATQAIVEASGVQDRVEFRGSVPKDELPALYGEADIFVFPTTSSMEGFGMVAAEAMACGTPVVASRIGPVPEVVLDGSTGLLFTPGDPEDLASKLNIVLNDEGMRAQLGAAAAAHAATFRWSTIGDSLVATPARRRSDRR